MLIISSSLFGLIVHDRRFFFFGYEFLRSFGWMDMTVTIQCEYTHLGI